MSSKDDLSGSEDSFEMDGVDMEEGASPELLEAIATLKAALHANPNQYEEHTQLITLLKSADMLEELREAREAMNAVFPLSEGLWMEWIEDESNMATSEDEKKHVLELYRRAASEYLSINIWKSYVAYATQEYMESKDLSESETVVSMSDMRKIFKEADKFTGHHIPQSHIIWNAWMDFELQQLANQTPAGSEDIKRVKTMYLERIAVPHTEQESTFSGLSSFISQYNSKDYEKSMVESSKIMSNTRKLLSEREQFEQELVTTNNSLEAFMNYLDFELYPTRKVFARVRTLFERALSAHCLVPALWNDYISFFLSSSARDKHHDLNPTEVLYAAGRSVRNCPWSGDLWENRFLLMEMYSRSEVEVNAGGDPYCRLERLWIELEANVLGDHEKARNLWKEIEGKQKTSSEFWIAQADMEQRLKNVKGARQIFVRACSAAKHLDWPEKVFEVWLMFERQYGDVTDYKDALLRSRSAMKIVEASRAQAAQQAESAYSEQAAYSVGAFAESVAVAGTNLEQASENTPKTNKRKASIQDDEHASKAAKTDHPGPDQAKERIRNQKRPLDISAGRHEDTCFVTNFPDSLTEAKMRELFQEYGTILRCTIPARPGTKRKFGYVQFASPEEANAALALDGRDVGEQRGLCVNISDTGKAKRTKGKAPLPKISRHELHISGFTNEMKEDELQKLVELYAKPTEVFIKRQPKSKGAAWANCKFESEEEADAALALDGTMFHGNPLIVKRREFRNVHWEKDDNQTADAAQGSDKNPKNRRQRRQEELEHAALQQEFTGVQATSGEHVETTTLSSVAADPAQKNVNLDTSAAGESNEDENAASSISEIKDGSKGATQRKPVAKLTSMQPRALQPRQAPKRAFKQAHRPAGVFGSTAATTSIVPNAGEVLEDGSSTTASAAPTAPKSNADFRALMLSGALKKKQA
ncbi:Splicing factor [Mortierella sp. GBA30]|nr:Splicing factor [Mortierella sp. GBA30]